MCASDSGELERAIGAMDAVNARDPQTASFRGREGPRELIFAQCVYEWVRRLDPAASETLQLAARGHTLERWVVPRSEYPMDRAGYHAWRDACAEHHANVAGRILKEQHFDDESIHKVAALTLKKNLPGDPEAQTLEDADCLAFLEMKLADYVDEWEPDKAVRILKRTLRKMSPKAREIANTLELDPRARRLLEQALA